MKEVKLYKRNAKGNIIRWGINELANGDLHIYHGIWGHKPVDEYIKPTKKKVSEIESRVAEKRKQGYKAIEDLYDNAPKEFDNSFNEYNYLKTYLPKYNTTESGFVLPMLAKTLEDNKPFEKVGVMLGQWKINGLRCIIGAKKSNDIFKPISLTYHSREGIDWTPNMCWFDEIILGQIHPKLLDLMVEEDVSLDGELYLPGYSVNEINSFVKNPKLPQHKLLQYWIYDICAESFTADARREELLNGFYANPYDYEFDNYQDHIANDKQLIVLPTYEVDDIVRAKELRDSFINLGFEGLILRNPYAEYAFGKRNSSMFKYKRKEDGWFEVLDIKADKRGLPIYTLKNDINDETFECTINLPQERQKLQLDMKQYLIGKRGFVEYRERSGVKQVPFHAKLIKIEV